MMLAEEVGVATGLATLLCACCGMATLHRHNVCVRCKTLVVFPSMRPELSKLRLSKTARRVFGKAPENVRRRPWGRWTSERDAALIAGYLEAKKSKALATLAAHLSSITGDGQVDVRDLQQRASRLGIT